MPFFTTLTDDERAVLHGARLPLPSARLHLDEGPIESLIDRVLAAEGRALREVRVKYPRDAFFSKGERAAVFLPQAVSQQAAPDELYGGKQKLILKFTLPRGSYATTLVKRITGEDAAAEIASAEADSDTADSDTADGGADDGGAADV